MSAARDAILARLGGAAGDAGAIAVEAAAVLGTPERPVVAAGMVEQGFAEQLATPSMGATLDHIDALADLPYAVARYLAAQDLPPALYLPPDAHVRALDWSGFDLHDQASPDQAAALAVARCGVAETGSLVFETAPDAPMLPNFLTLHHIVLVERLVAQLEDALHGGAPPRAHYWVTGVSGTTDIEGTYVRGAHGPRFLHVVRLGADAA